MKDWITGKEVETPKPITASSSEPRLGGNIRGLSPLYHGGRIITKVQVRWPHSIYDGYRGNVLGMNGKRVLVSVMTGQYPIEVNFKLNHLIPL